jgi:hypothetical protein
MVAFFERVGKASVQRLDASKAEDKKPFETTRTYLKKVYGTVHIRTDGKRVLVVSMAATQLIKKATPLRWIKQEKSLLKKKQEYFSVEQTMTTSLAPFFF